MINKVDNNSELLWCLNKHAQLVCDSLEIFDISEREMIINDFESKLNKYLKEINDGVSDFIITKNNNDLIGFIWIKYSNNAYTNTKNIYIMNIFIENIYRGQGIAKELIQEVKNIAFKKNIKRIYCQIYNDNERSLKLFRKNGFEEKATVLEINS